MQGTKADALLATKNVSKSFGAVRALRNVDFELYYNEIVGLVGDNGAGKSTLIKILCGALQPDRGEIYLEGERVEFSSPLDSRRMRIEVIYQDLALVDCLEVRENIFLGKLLTKNFLGNLIKIVDRKKMLTESQRLLKSIGIDLFSQTVKVSSLSGGQKKAVAIARAMYWNTKIIIMDEPTAALGVSEVKKLLDLLRSLKSKGVSIIFISHNLQEIFSTVDRIVVLSKGELMGVRKTEETTQDEILKLIMGGEIIDKPSKNTINPKWIVSC